MQALEEERDENLLGKLQIYLNKLYAEKGEVDKQILDLSRIIDRLVVEDLKKRTKLE